MLQPGRQLCPHPGSSLCSGPLCCGHCAYCWVRATGLHMGNAAAAAAATASSAAGVLVEPVGPTAASLVT